ncbi:hypothetical protein M8C21_005441 [Ambrosia artemisiifolia]|uniref:Uncharacterized protein n=1 Tax=Ambrosia artemisiifolia TaxID=4212 RepID=A0AAD5D847_AMBAR|nr:hypothetical protein M8C21_005441 [Ambrosia artemisiifolia]
MPDNPLLVSIPPPTAVTSVVIRYVEAFARPLDTGKNNSGNVRKPRPLPHGLQLLTSNCRPLLVDLGRCSCIIFKHNTVDELNGGSLNALYTNIMVDLCSLQHVHVHKGEAKQMLLRLISPAKQEFETCDALHDLYLS